MGNDGAIFRKQQTQNPRGRRSRSASLFPCKGSMSAVAGKGAILLQ
jgi:hypothetical protein